MERICPFLALADDLRSAADGYDPEHRCRAVSPVRAIERSVQVSFCLSEAHSRCPLFVERSRAAGGGVGSTESESPVAADLALASTRLLVEPGRWSGLGRRGPGRRLGIGVAGALVILLVAGATVYAGGLPRVAALFSALTAPAASPLLPGGAGRSGNPASVPPSSAADATPTVLPTAIPSYGESVGPSPTAVVLSPTVAPSASATAPGRTYVVQAGDTLSLIATRFGTTVAALKAANRIRDANAILIGQTLVIP